MRLQKCYRKDVEGQWPAYDTQGGSPTFGVSPAAHRGSAAALVRTFPSSSRGRPRAAEPELHLVDGCANIDIILLPGFDGYNLSALADVLSTANRVDGRQRYAYRLLGLSGAPTRSSSGYEVETGGALKNVAGKANVALVGSCGPTTEDFPALCNWVRYQSRLGSKFIGVASGVSVLAAAGVTYGRKVAATLRARQIWREIYPDMDFIDAMFCVDENLITTPGGRATIHAAMAIVKKVSGPEIATCVADHLNLDSVRGAAELPAAGAAGFSRAKDDILIRAREQILDRMDRPVSSEDLSRRLGISTRQLQRIFKTRLNMSPRAYYAACRLDYARDLIQQTEMSVTEAAVAAGFVSLSHFSKCYRRRFGTHPRTDRRLQ